MEVRIPYGEESLTLEIPRERLLALVSPHDVEVTTTTKDAVRRSLLNPVGSEPIRARARKARSAVVACDDLTRVTPAREILSWILKDLKEGGVKRRDILILVALGTHRKMRDRELRERLGEEVVEEYTVLNHVADDEARLGYRGTLEGVPIWINKDFLKADLRIGVGNIIPHHSVGYGGGSKIILPGLSGEETVGRMHLYAATTSPNALGRLDTPVRRVMNACARETGLHFIVNTVLTRDKRVAGVFSGHFEDAHREGVERARSVYEVPVPGEADITVASSHPADMEFWQAQKALFSADLATKEGGSILLVSPCVEGVAVNHPDWLSLVEHDPEWIEDAIREDGVADLTAASVALSLTAVRKKYRVAIVSDGVSYDEADRLRLEKFDTVNDAYGALAKPYGPDLKVNVLTHGGETYPRIDSKPRR